MFSIEQFMAAARKDQLRAKNNGRDTGATALRRGNPRSGAARSLRKWRECDAIGKPEKLWCYLALHIMLDHLNHQSDCGDSSCETSRKLLITPD